MIYPENFEYKIGFDYVRTSILEKCSTLAGRECVNNMVFCTDYSDVVEKLASVWEMVTLISSGTPVPMGGIGNVEQYVSALRVPGSFLSASEFRELLSALRGVEAIISYFKAHYDDEAEKSDVPHLNNIASGLVALPECASAIDRVVDRFGNVRDNASTALADIRRELSSAVGSVNMAMRRVMARAMQEGYLEADATPTMRDGRLVVPVAPMNKRKISGIVHDESASGKTVYIEPAEVVSANNRIRELQLEERREVTRILMALADELRPHLNELQENSEIVGRLDFVNAKALFAQECDAHMPTLHDGPEMEWYHACHPGLLASLRRHGKEIVPLDITLSSNKRILVISGPNAGGKSVCLKTVGVVQYMAQSGVLPPLYENSHMGIFEDIFIDIGDDQSLEDDLSTYSSHLRNMKLILQKGSGVSLLLIDEFGGGTEPQIGGALAQAILKQINNMKMWGVITTHYQNLKHFAEDTDGLVNGSMLYDRHLMQPLFKLSIGNPGSSFALEIARKTGLPREIIDDASEIVGSDYVNLDKYLLDIARDRRYWENKRQDIRKKEKKLEGVIAQYENDAETLREHRREIIADAKAEAERILSGSNAAIERTILTIREAQADRERTLEARRKLKAEAEKMAAEHGKTHPLLKKAPKAKNKKVKPSTPKANIEVGSVVKLDGEGTPGKVLRMDGNKALVAFGLLKTEVEMSRLRVGGTLPSATGKSQGQVVMSGVSDSSRARQLNFKREIDVRGMRVDEAVQAVTYFIDDAIQFSAGRVRILHGTGTGALRQYIRQYLQTVPGVKSARDEHVQFGGAGITVVDLE